MSDACFTLHTLTNNSERLYHLLQRIPPPARGHSSESRPVFIHDTVRQCDDSTDLSALLLWQPDHFLCQPANQRGLPHQLVTVRAEQSQAALHLHGVPQATCQNSSWLLLCCGTAHLCQGCDGYANNNLLKLICLFRFRPLTMHTAFSHFCSMYQSNKIKL